MHLDLFGPIFVMSLERMQYTLVVVDDFSRFTCVVFFGGKDHTNNKLIKLLKRVQNEKFVQVNRIRICQDIEFTHKSIEKFYMNMVSSMNTY